MTYISEDQCADWLIERLNKLIESPALCKDIAQLFTHRIYCCEAATQHPTLQTEVDGTGDRETLGFLGLLNGLIGTIPSGSKQGWGYITAVWQCGQLVRFERTDKKR